MSKRYQIGAIIENEQGQFAKVVSVRNGVYGLAGWATRKVAENASIANVFLNGYGLRNANVKVTSSASKAAPAKDDAKSEHDAPAAPKARKSQKTASKSTITKPAVKKPAKRAQEA